MSPAALPGGRIVFTILTAGTHQLGMVDLDKPGEHRLLPFSAGGSTPKYIASGHINAGMPHHVVDLISTALNTGRKSINGSKVLIAGSPTSATSTTCASPRRST